MVISRYPALSIGDPYGMPYAIFWVILKLCLTLVEGYPLMA
jgi:hypothetical protein